MSIFVFGSNLAGIHGGGAAYDAKMHHGAKLHQGKGLQGRSYALPTKGWTIQTLPLGLIRKYVDEFIEFAATYPELEFKVTRVGCGLAGYTDADIAPLFMNAPDNCTFDEAWLPFLNNGSIRRAYWGHK